MMKQYRSIYFLLFFVSFSLLAYSDEMEPAVKGTVIITGSSQGIGFETARKFQQNGWSVWAGTRKLTEELIRSNPEIRFRNLDINSEDSISKFIDEIIRTDGQINVLVNNAGYGLLGAVETISVEEAKRQFEVNFFSVLRMVNSVSTWMRKQNSGTIINISSTSGVRAVPGLGMYAASKFALEGYSEALAVELSPWNIKVAIVEPGTVNNSWARHCSMSDNQTGEEFYDHLSHKLLSKLIMLSSGGQDCGEVADLIVDIAEGEHSFLRYQTNEQVRKVLSESLVDPTGNAYQVKWRAFMEDLVGGGKE